RNVTGVQTCALPIFHIEGKESQIRTYLYDYLVNKITEDNVNISTLYESYSPILKYLDNKDLNFINDTYNKLIAIHQSDIKLSARSEERRVGKKLKIK